MSLLTRFYELELAQAKALLNKVKIDGKWQQLRYRKTLVEAGHLQWARRVNANRCRLMHMTADGA